MRPSLQPEGNSFVEASTRISELWANVPGSHKDAMENETFKLRMAYRASTAEYEKTQNYATYQGYLKQFEAEELARSTSAPEHSPPDVSGPSSSRSFTSLPSPSMYPNAQSLPEGSQSAASAPAWLDPAIGPSTSYFIDTISTGTKRRRDRSEERSGSPSGSVSPGDEVGEGSAELGGKPG